MTDRVNVWMGVDPGLSGAIAVVHYPMFAKAYPLRDLDDGGIFALVGKIKDEFDVTFALIEEVGIRPGDERRPGLIKLFKSFGSLRMAILGHQIRLLDPILPRSWQSQMGCPNRRGDKSISFARAVELFPDIQVTLQTADALLLARLCQWNAPLSDLVPAKKSWRNFYDNEKSFRADNKRRKARFLRQARRVLRTP
jgi:hypothetical protein